MPDQLDRDLDGVTSLHDPVRRSLYRYVAARRQDVGRDEAARAVGVSRALAAFHLDKLVAAGLLAATFRRLTGRSGPGAGRPAKLYRRAPRDIAVSVPPRRYDLAARILAEAAAGRPETAARISAAARTAGAEIGAEARERVRPRAGGKAALAAAVEVLESWGFEPEREKDGAVRLRNCPFDAISAAQPQLVCGMNLAFMEGVLDGLGPVPVGAVLDPQPGRCCVVFRPSA